MPCKTLHHHPLLGTLHLLNLNVNLSANENLVPTITLDFTKLLTPSEVGAASSVPDDSCIIYIVTWNQFFYNATIPKYFHCTTECVEQPYQFLPTGDSKSSNAPAVFLCLQNFL